MFPHWPSVSLFRHVSFITIGKKAGFLRGDRLKMDKHKAWAYYCYSSICLIRTMVSFRTRM